MATKFGLKKLETSLYRVVQKVFQYLESFRRGLTTRAKNAKYEQIATLCV